MKERNPIVFLTATVTLMFLLVMGGSTLLPALALEAPPYYHTQWGSYGSGDVLPAGGAAECSELLTNGGFEVKDLAWQTFGAESPPAYTTSPVFSGEQAMRLGIAEGANLAIINGVRQNAFLPNSASSLILGFHYHPIHESLPGDDLQYLDIYDANSGLKLYQLHGTLNNSANWIFLQYDLTPLKGKTIRIEVGVRNDGGSGRTALIIDDLSLLSCDAGAVPTVTPTGISVLATPTPTPTNLSLTLTPTAPVSPTLVISATATPMTSGRVSIVAIHYDGTGNSEPDEYIAFQNVDSFLIQIKGWTMRDDNGHVFTFPTFLMQPGQVCRVYTDEFHPDWCGFTYRNSFAIWNNESDCAFLRDRWGTPIDTYCYP